MEWNDSGGSLLPADGVEDGFLEMLPGKGVADGFPDMRLYELLDYGVVENFGSASSSGSGSGSRSGSDNEWDVSKDELFVVEGDVLDRLPTDPFGMDMRLSVSSWVRDFENYDNVGDENELFEEMSRVWESNEWSESAVEVVCSDEESSLFHLGDRECGDFRELEGSAESEVIVEEVRESRECDKVGSNEGADIHEGFFLALGYLSLKDLFTVEQVCKTLRDAVRGDPLLWQNIHIDYPLHTRITDDPLVQLTNRAQGTLRSLLLPQCMRITDNGLARVLENNPRIVKLSVSGCVKLSAECILLHLRALRSAGLPGIRYLRVGEAPHLSTVQFEEVKTLLGGENCTPVGSEKPWFYKFDKKHLSFDDDRPLDVDICPRCQKVRPIYDCPAESCQEESSPTRLCRACIACVSRCVGCGKCVEDQEYEETLWFEVLCLECWGRFPRPGEGDY